MARRYEELECWRLAVEVKRHVYAFTAEEPARRDFKFCEQIRESARSAPRNIAEGFARFRPADFARFLDIARGSLVETHNHVRDGVDLHYLTESDSARLLSVIDRATAAATKLIVYLRSPRAMRYRG